MAQKCNLFLDKGSDFDVTVLLVGVNYEPLDLQDMQFTCMARFIMNPKICKIIMCEVTYPESGEILLKIPYYATEDMRVGEWLYDVEMTYSQGRQRKRILEGHLTVTGEVTHSCYFSY